MARTAVLADARTVLGFYQSPYMPCPDCGASVAVVELDAHVCDEGRRLKYRLFQLRGEVAAFEEQLAAYLASPRGRFEVWYAKGHRG